MLVKTPTPRKPAATVAFTGGRTGAPRAVVVERKPSRRIMTGSRVGWRSLHGLAAASGRLPHSSPAMPKGRS